MAKIHGLIFIIVGLLTSITSFLIGNGMVLFIFVGIGFVAFGAVRLFINGGKLKPNEEIRREILEKRSYDRYNNPPGDRYSQMYNQQRINNNQTRSNQPNNHYVSSTEVNPYYNRNPAVNHVTNNNVNPRINNSSRNVNNYNHGSIDNVNKINPDNHRIYNR